MLRKITSGDYMAWLFALVFILNIAYIVLFRFLMKTIENGAHAYWLSIGAPSSLSANHTLAIISQLYGSKIKNACKSADAENLLLLVRVLLPAAFLSTGAAFFIIYRALA